MRQPLTDNDMTTQTKPHTTKPETEEVQDAKGCLHQACSPSSTDLFHITFDAPGQAQWVKECMNAVRECLDAFCSENSPKTDIHLWVGRIYGPLRKKANDKLTP